MTKLNGAFLKKKNLTGFVLCLLAAVASPPDLGWAEEAAVFSQGIWATPQSNSQMPKLRVEVNSGEKKVFLTLFRHSKVLSDSVGITFIGPQGQRTLVELKTMDPHFPQRFDGSLSRMEPFIGFEIKFPLGSTKSKTYHSGQLEKAKN